MSPCYRTGGCGPYEMYSCSECPASKPDYLLKDLKVFVAVINGEVKDNYMAIGFSEKQAKENILKAFFNESGHTEKELEDDYDCYLTVTKFSKEKMYATDSDAVGETEKITPKKVECDFSFIFLAIRKHITDFPVMQKLTCDNKHFITRELTYLVLNELDCTNPYEKDVNAIQEIINRFTEDDIDKLIEKSSDKINLSDKISDKTSYDHVSVSEHDDKEKCYVITGSYISNKLLKIEPIAKVYDLGVVMFLNDMSSRDPQILNIVEKILTTMI